MKNIILIIAVFVITVSYSQDKKYAKQCLAKLVSPEFHGRGFTENGDKIAAKFIINELKKNNVKPITDKYTQNFGFAINTFPYPVSLSFNNKKLKLGSEYLIQPLSGTVKGKFEYVYFDSTKTDYKNKFVVIDKKRLPTYSTYRLQEIEYTNYIKAKGIIEIIDGNLMQVHSPSTKDYVWLQVKRENFDSLSTTLQVDVKNKFYYNYESQNICGFVQGKVDTFIVFTCHYDHVGEVGKEAVFPGANDNGSGTVTVLDLAKHYASLKGKPHYSIAFLFFSAEEVGLLGSKYYALNPTINLKKIKFLINLDMIGSGEKGIAIVNAKENNKATELIKSINEKNKYFDHIKIRGNAQNSDHYYFSQVGVPAIFIYTEGNYKEYHSIYDKYVDQLLTRYKQMFNLMTKFVDEYK